MIPHGWYFVIGQVVLVAALLPLQRWWVSKRSAAGKPVHPFVPRALNIALALQWVLFRVQPYLRSGTIVETSLFVFDAVTVVGLALPWWLARRS